MRAAIVLLAAAPLWAQVEANVTVDLSRTLEPIEIGRYGLGQGGLSDAPMFDSHVDALRALRVKLIRLFVQEYFDVYPGHGVYNWKTLDRAVETILATGARPLLSVCIKPHALYPVIDQDRTDPSDWAEWEELIYRMVQRYPAVKYWEVFNEPDIGEDGGCPGRFTPDGYVRYYEHTVRAIRRANPRAKVGGPALASWRSPLLPALLAHCGQGKSPLDFVSWHIYNSDPAAIRKTVEGVKALLAGYPALKCETVLDEWNMSLSKPRTEAAFQPAFTLETIAQIRASGLDYCAYYQIRDWHVSPEQFGRFMSPEGNRNMANWWNLTPQYDGLFDFQGIMRPTYFVFHVLGRLTGRRVEAESDVPGVKVLAAWDEEQRMLHALVWNFALETPPEHRVNVTLKSLAGRRWMFRRYVLNTRTASNQENDRLPVAGFEETVDLAEMRAGFTLPPYGITLITLRRLK